MTTTPATAPAPDAMRSMMAAAHRFGIAQRTVFGITANTMGLSRAALGTLIALERQGHVHVNALAQHLRIDLSVASRQVSLLEKAGLVSRDVDPQDRRARVITVTEQGAATAATARASLVAHLTEAMSTWDTTDLEQATGHLNRLGQALLDQADRAIPCP